MSCGDCQKWYNNHTRQMMLSYFPLSNIIIRHRTQWLTNVSSNIKILYNCTATRFPYCPDWAMQIHFPSLTFFLQFAHFWNFIGLAVDYFALSSMHYGRDTQLSYIFYVYGSVHHNILYEITNRCSYMQSIYSTARFTLHVSGVLYTHHQEYNF